MSDMEAFEQFLNEKDKFNIVSIGFKPSDLRGIGTEYLVSNGEVIAKFFDGCMIVVTLGNNSEKTVTVA